MGDRCRLDLGPVTVSADQVRCNGSQAIAPPLSLTGAGNAYASVSFFDCETRVFFAGVNLDGAVSISGSSVALLFEGENAVLKVACAADSKVSPAAGISRPCATGLTPWGLGLGLGMRTHLTLPKSFSSLSISEFKTFEHLSLSSFSPNDFSSRCKRVARF
jgi:hypothetical protein